MREKSEKTVREDGYISEGEILERDLTKTDRAWGLVPRLPVNLHGELFLCPEIFGLQ